MQVTLPRRGLKLDPRVNNLHRVRFDCRYHDDDEDDGITVTLTRLPDDGHETGYIGCAFNMRVFDPDSEDLPDFTSTSYRYFGHDLEYAPSDTTEVIIDQSVKTIKRGAFSHCTKIKSCVMHNQVETIDERAFSECVSLDALFLPSSIKKIGNFAFYKCTNVRIISIPDNVSMCLLGKGIIQSCYQLFHTTQIQPYQYHIGIRNNDNEVNRAIFNFHYNLPPLHKACLDINVTEKSIRQCIDTHGISASGAFSTAYGGMTPLQILALNPHADQGTILACFEVNMGAVFEVYSICDKHGRFKATSDKTVLNFLANHNQDVFLQIVTTLCLHRCTGTGNDTEQEDVRTIESLMMRLL